MVAEVASIANADESVVSLLESALECAREGKLRNVVIVGVWREDMVFRGYARADADTPTLIGGLEAIKHQILCAQDTEIQDEIAQLMT